MNRFISVVRNTVVTLVGFGAVIIFWLMFFEAAMGAPTLGGR